MIEAAILVVFPFAMVHAAVSDMLSMTIINRVSALLIASFLLIAPLTGMDVHQIGLHLAAFAIVLSVCFGLFAMGAMGGGDAKLMASTSLWFGLSIELAHYLLISSAIGGILTIWILRYRGSSLAVFAGQAEFLRRLADPDEKIPYGIALGIGGLAIFPSSPLALWVIERLAAN
jgi:prepilin peptidase CpaA